MSGDELTPAPHLRELVDAADEWRRTNDRHKAATDRLRAAMRASVDAGWSEYAVAREADVDRMTVRKALGKR